MNNFVERLLFRSNDRRRVSEIKPAITPYTLPESLELPAENFIPAALIHSDMSRNVLRTEREEIAKSEVNRRALSSLESDQKAIETSDNQQDVSHESRAIDGERSEVSEIEVNPSLFGAEARGQSEARQKSALQGISEIKQAADPMARTDSPPIEPKAIPEAKSPGTAEMPRTDSPPFEPKAIPEAKSPGTAEMPRTDSPPFEPKIIPEAKSPGTAEMPRTDSPPFEPKAIPEAKPPGTSKKVEIGTSDRAINIISQNNQQGFTAKEQKAQQIKAAESSDRSVTITIGRIEVHAIMPEKPEQREAAPRLSLQDYLTRRLEGTL